MCLIDRNIRKKKKSARTALVEAIFGIPDLYVLIQEEVEKHFNYIREGRGTKEACVFRFLYCSNIFNKLFVRTKKRCSAEIAIIIRGNYELTNRRAFQPLKSAD